VLDAVKAHRRARVHLEDRDTADAPDPNPPTWERLDDARLYEALAACCGELGEHLRSAVLLRYQQGFTFEDMAEVCGEKPGTLQARVARALPKLHAGDRIGHSRPPVRASMHARSFGSARATRACRVPGFSPQTSAMSSNVNPC